MHAHHPAQQPYACLPPSPTVAACHARACHPTGRQVGYLQDLFAVELQHFHMVWADMAVLDVVLGLLQQVTVLKMGAGRHHGLQGGEGEGQA